jgi:DNA-binding response OmpR family regulator
MPLPKSILVVDDEATIRDVVSRYLQREGFRVREAADGYACLDAIADQAPDLIILDLMLPGIDGLTITRQLRLNPKHKAIPIVMLTAKGETNDRIRGLDIGATSPNPSPRARSFLA